MKGYHWKALSFKTITKSIGVSMKELWMEMCVLEKWYQYTGGGGGGGGVVNLICGTINISHTSRHRLDSIDVPL